ncbi:MAG: hypothetical protein KC656_30280, partial [Myxococcales bacterium]|nr:hypothetical protein [Myxococcales bacterium]
AGRSLLANVPLDQATLAFLVDPGNEGTLGHRRWLLSSWVDGLEAGSTDQYACLELVDVDLDAEGPAFTAWPPPGEVPRELLETHGYTTDAVGWSIQSDRIDLSTARVVVRAGGRAHEVDVEVLAPGVGSASAVSFTVDRIPRASRYDVEVHGVPDPFGYTVSIVDCSPEGVW